MKTYFKKILNLILISTFILVSINPIINVTATKIDLIGHKQLIHEISWNPDGSLIATKSVNNTLKIWDPTDGTIKWSIDFERPIRTFLWHPQGDRIVVILYRHSGVSISESHIVLKIVEVASGIVQKNITFPSSFNPFTGSLRPNSNLFALSYSFENSTTNKLEYRLEFLDLITENFTQIISTNSTFSSVWFDNGNKLAFLDGLVDNIYLNIWDATENNITSVRKLEGVHKSPDYPSTKPSLSVNPDNTLLAYGFSYKEKDVFSYITKHGVNVYDLTNTNRSIPKLEIESQCSGLSWKNNNELFVGTRGNGSRLWNINDVEYSKDHDVQYFFDIELGINDIEWDRNTEGLAYTYSNITSIISFDEISFSRVKSASSDINFAIISLIMISLYFSKKKIKI
ncbi:MAG: WD40 repeat domain-containing protein [Candidatus Hodarchaeales archaeon]